MELKKLNFGCGSIQPEGWDNLDSDPLFDIFTDRPILSTTLEVSDNTYDIIVAHCSLQMIAWHDMAKELSELHRMLKSGGVLRVSLPDIERGFEAFKMGNINWFPNREENIDERFSAWLTWYSTSKSLLTSQALSNKLEEAGFVDIMPIEFAVTNSEYPEATHLDTREGECYFVECKK